MLRFPSEECFLSKTPYLPYIVSGAILTAHIIILGGIKRQSCIGQKKNHKTNVSLVDIKEGREGTVPQIYFCWALLNDRLGLSNCPIGGNVRQYVKTCLRSMVYKFECYYSWLACVLNLRG
jgi:hypothetical protein